METMVSSVSASIFREPANYDEISVKQLLFADSLKDLKNLRTQLYSAADYFELSLTSDNQKQIVVDTLKDYTIKALVNTVDHLGSVSYKVNDLLHEKVDQVSKAELRVSCIEQRLRTCQEYIDHEGLSQQSLVINSPKYHKRYILPVGETIHGASQTKSRYQGCPLDDEDDWHQFRNAVEATIKETPSSSVRRGRSLSPSPRPLERAGTFSFTGSTTTKEIDKRTTSPYRFPLLRSGSLSTRPTTSNSRSTTPNLSRPNTSSRSVERRRHPSEPRRSASMYIRAEKEKPKEIEQYPSKSKRLFKSLLSRRKSKKDDMLYTYLDEY
ncbi:protein ABIL2-like [Diospyros lotus]|uniref:protein ABIL2-like n=1 Tax=Diospyros lotus TaxID=55363 RepID=UPI0022564DAB|nr:protein ABIL2-like [Diospyros lotus]XP_052186057.1 protein ABIL2-like [Diospyros lotus]